MSLILDKDESFTLQANVTSPGQQRVILSGYITERRPDGLYAASLLPQLFYGADGSQLSTWRQNIPGTGEQTILSRSAGSPMIPREEMFWRKVSDFTKEPVKVDVAPLVVSPLLLRSVLGFIGGGTLIILVGRKR